MGVRRGTGATTLTYDYISTEGKPRAHGFIRVTSAALGLPAASDHENDPADQADPTENGRKRHRLLAIGAHLQRAGVDYLLAFCVAKAAISERDDPNRDQNQPNDADRFHALDRVRETGDPGPN